MIFGIGLGGGISGGAANAGKLMHYIIYTLNSIFSFHYQKYVNPLQI